MEKGWKTLTAMGVALGMFLSFTTTTTTTDVIRRANSALFDMIFDPQRPLCLQHPTHLGVSQNDFDNEGMKHIPQLWENSLRTDMSPGTFEWWYVDGFLDDGTMIVIIYATKPFTEMYKGPAPAVRTMVFLPDGTKTIVDARFDADESRISTKRLDLKIGPNYFHGNLKKYAIFFSNNESLVINLILENEATPYRPGNGHFYYGESNKHFFGWLASVPRGRITGSLFQNGETRNVTGIGYHEHGWGNIGLPELFRYWWWSRAHIGNFTVIAAQIQSRNKYGAFNHMIFMLATTTTTTTTSTPEGIIIADGSWPGSTVTLTEANIQRHPDPNAVNKPIAKTLIFHYTNGDDFVSLEVSTLKMVESVDLLLHAGNLPRLAIWLARLMGKYPWYTRFQVNAVLRYRIGGSEEALIGEGNGVLENMDLQ